jgi:FkbM family methyltransferase
MALSALKTVVGREAAKHFPRLWMERELRFRPNHFERELFLTRLFCDRKKIAIDVGANEGAYSYYLSRYCAKVIAFEPNTDLHPNLRRLLGPDFAIEAVALSRESSSAVIRIDPSNTGVSTIEESNNLSCVADMSAVIERSIQTRTLDSFGFSDVSLIKIDVEGHEEAVIAGAWETIRRNRPVLIVESEDRHNPGARGRLSSALTGAGYRGFYVKGERLMDYESLKESEFDPSPGGSGEAYINNFIFIPADRGAKIDEVREFLAGTAGR